MANSPNLDLPFIAPAQAQKHVTHNEALRTLDAIVQLAVLDRDLATPPLSPQDGDRYIVATAASGAWTGKEGQIAAWQDGAWAFHVPREGWRAWVEDEDLLIAWDGTSWAAVSGSGGSVNPAPLVGVNMSADATNRLAVSSPASLFTHEGAGHQIKVNKNAALDTASLLYQTGFSGRAELGLAGDDDFHVKVSADGTTWKEAILIDRSTGSVSFPNTAPSGGGGTASSVSVKLSADQTIAHETITALAWNVENWDTDGFHDTVVNNTRLTVPAGLAGKYLVALSVQWGNSDAGLRQYMIRINGVTMIANILLPNNGGGQDSYAFSIVWDLAEGDYLEALVWQGSGGNLVVQGLDTSNFSMTRLGA